MPLRGLVLPAGRGRFTVFLAPKMCIRDSLGVALEHLGDFQGAYEQYKTAAELSPDYGAAHSDLGGLFARIGMADAAVKELRLALSLWPADEKTRMKLINAEVMLRQKASPTVAGAAEAGQ